jgi:molybdopterin converting factor small subunit
MKLLIQYSGPLRAAVGRAEEELDFTENAMLADVLQELARRRGEDAAAHLITASGQAPLGLLVVVNGSAVASSQLHQILVRCGDVIALLPPIAGG